MYTFELTYLITYLIDKKCDVLESKLENVFLLPSLFCLCLLSSLNIYNEIIITEMHGIGLVLQNERVLR